MAAFGKAVARPAYANAVIQARERGGEGVWMGGGNGVGGREIGASGGEGGGGGGEGGMEGGRE
jgi:hypothetical protein